MIAAIMNWKLTVLTASAIILAVIGAAYFSFVSYAAIGNLNVYSGTADIISGSAKTPGTTGAPIKISDEISVAGQSRISIVLKDGSVIRLEGGSDVRVAELSYQGGKIKNALFSLTVGRIWSHVAPISSGGNFAVETPTAVATVRGTAFSVTRTDARTGLFVAARTVGFALRSDPENEKLVSPGEIFIVHDADLENDFLNGPIVAASSSYDDWINFNEAEDAKLGEPDEAQAPAATTTSAAPTSTTKSTAVPPRTVPPKTVQPKNTTTTSAPPPAPVTAAPAKTVSSLSLTAAATTVVKNNPLALKVIAMYSDGSSGDVTGKVAWSQSPNLGLIDNLNNFHGFNAGQTTITATFGGATSNGAQITVTEPPTAPPAKTLSRIAVTYQKDATGQYATYQALPSAQFTATAYWSDETTEDVTAKTAWSVAGGGTANGNINASGLYTAGAYEGQDTVDAQFGGASASTVIQVP